MSIFNLPDLGEGLPDAEVHEWFVKVGETVKTDQPLVSMETAKAVVDVPSPQDGVIKKLYGGPGDIIQTGSALVEFEGTETKREDSGTVVGNIEVGSQTITEEMAVSTAKGAKVKITPAVRALAKKLKVDLAVITPSGSDGSITKQDVERANQSLQAAGDLEPLRGVRRSMATIMAQSHAEVVAVSIYDDADIHAWADKKNFTERLIRAIIKACAKEPALNAWFDSKQVGRRLHDKVNLGLAVDTEDGLFVPVIEDVAQFNPEQLRDVINDTKQKVQQRELPPEQLRGATITLSNFGTFAGRYASPIIVPPTVAIIAAGRIRDAVVAFNNEPAVHKVLPLSVSFDHRAVTGGEATRFLGLMIEDLQLSE